MTDVRSNLEAMLARGQDSALLRFSLGNLCLQRDDPVAAVEHLQQAVAQDAAYSAAWKLLGRALFEGGDRAAARAAWQQGIEVATKRGDMQAVREMQVFLRRLERDS